jgi:hypothetical protein
VALFGGMPKFSIFLIDADFSQRQNFFPWDKHRDQLAPIAGLI